MNLIHLHNSAHLGDNILQINYLRRMVKYQPEANGIRTYHDVGFVYACKDEYHGQLQPLIADLSPHFINIISLEKRDSESVETWIGHEGFYYNHPDRYMYDVFYTKWFQYLSVKLNLPNPIKDHKDVLFDHPDIHPTKEFDILFVNCPPLSGQFVYHKDRWDKNILRLSKKFNVFPLHPVPGIPTSAVAMGLDVLAIGCLAAGAKHVVGICTGPLHTCFNTRAIDKVEKWDIFTHNKKYCYNERIQMHTTDAYLNTI